MSRIPGGIVQSAVIERVRPSAVRVRVDGCSACENCNCNALLRWTRSRPHSFWLRSADAAQHWREQQPVQLVVASGRMVAATALLYGLPLVGWLTGAALGAAWGDLATLAASLSGLAVAIAIAARLARRHSYGNVTLLASEE